MCLKGVKRTVYDNVVKSHEYDSTPPEPEVVYKEIKDALMCFSETPMEKTVRVRTEWRTFEKTRHMGALEFRTKFYKYTAQLEEVGMPSTAAEKLMSYFEKVGPSMSQIIRLDRRQRPDGSGGTTERLPETWEEAHAVWVELEAAQAGTNMLRNPQEALSKAAGSSGQVSGG